jgi:hypothetical protein
LQKRREEERICRREYALILVARLNLSPEVARLIVLFAVPARAFNSGQACDLINVEDIPPVAGGRVAPRRRLTEDIVAGFSRRHWALPSNDNVSGSREVMPGHNSLVKIRGEQFRPKVIVENSKLWGRPESGSK